MTIKGKSALLSLALVAIVVSFFGFQVGAEPIVRPELIKISQPKLERFSFTQLQMAMPMQITVWTDSKQRAEEACKIAFGRSAELVKTFSDYDDCSEASQLMRAEIGKPHPITEHLLTVLELSQDLNRKSEGAFDPTASPVIRLWRTARKNSRLPEAHAIDKALATIGFENIKLDPQAKTLTILASDIELDFGGIAKGYIGDQVIESLQEYGVRIACYKCGGDIVLGDAPPESTGWLIDVGQFESGDEITLRLENCAISTSGDAEQFVEFEGVRYSHVVDPRTGFGVTTGRTAFVVASSGMLSDALATVGCVIDESDFQRITNSFPDTKSWTTQNELNHDDLLSSHPLSKNNYLKETLPKKELESKK